MENCKKHRKYPSSGKENLCISTYILLIKISHFAEASWAKCFIVRIHLRCFSTKYIINLSKIKDYLNRVQYQKKKGRPSNGYRLIIMQSMNVHVAMCVEDRLEHMFF
jgi:hypothetical protein